MHAVLILMLISTILPVSIANAAFLEDYADTPYQENIKHSPVHEMTFTSYIFIYVLHHYATWTVSQLNAVS